MELKVSQQLAAILGQVNASKTGERSDSQRLLAVLATQLEQCVAFAQYQEASAERASEV